jgi:hypothetical protein
MCGITQTICYFWNAAVALDRTALPLDEGKRFSLCQPEPLKQLFQASPHLGDVEIRAIDVPTIFRDFDDYWSPFLGGQGPAPVYVMSLSQEQKVILREYLKQRLPIAADGSIHLIARAWAVRGLHKN